MYTRSRNFGGGSGVGNGRAPMNSNNPFAPQNPYNSQGGHPAQFAYKQGLIEPSAPFKPTGPAVPDNSQIMKPSSQLQEQPQPPQPPTMTPTTPKLKPILKQPSQGIPSGNAQPTPTPVPPPSNVATPGAQPTKNDNTGTARPEGTPNQNADNSSGATANPFVKGSADAPEGGNDDQPWMDTEDGQQERPKWKRFKKLSGYKPNKKLKRLRMNQRLRKSLMPKNAIMVLNEMKAGVQFTFPETQAIMPNSLFLVHAELDGKIYVGQGLSKPLARQNAAENALKCLLLEKMSAAAMKERTETDGDAAMETSPTGDETGNSAKDENGEESLEDEDVPWSSLASFALYKLFLEWQNQGTVVPIPRPGVPAPSKAKAEPKPTVDKQLPSNAVDIHPVMLLNQMRPGTTYTEVDRIGTPPNIQFTLGVEINGSTYTGTAKNKKDAKKLAAKEALKALYNLTYPEETNAPKNVEAME